MLVVCSDTHGTDDPRLTGRTREAVANADLAVHAGDLATSSVLDAFRERAARLVAVHGNADDAAVRDRLPSAATVAYGGVRIAVTHTERGGPTARSLFGRGRGAALVVTGHTHRPSVTDSETGPTLLNPGSHAEPRGTGAAHAGASSGTRRTLDPGRRRPTARRRSVRRYHRRPRWRTPNARRRRFRPVSG